MKTLVAIVLGLVATSGVLSTAQDQKQEGKKSEPAFALKEMNVFHKILHPLVHDALPNNDFAAIRSKLDTLLAEAKALQQAKLPKKFAGRKEEFKRQTEELVSQLTDLVSMKDIVDDATLEKLFNDMHESFESLGEILR